MSTAVTVNFRGTDIYASQQGGVVFVALKPIVEAMGLDWSAQTRRVRRDPILREGIAMMAIPSGRGMQRSLALKLDLLNGWLFKIDSLRIKDSEIRRRVQMFQRECYTVLYEYFHGARKVLARGKEWSIAAKTRLVTEVRQTFGNAAAVEMYYKLELPTVPAMDEAFKQLDLFRSTPSKKRNEGAPSNTGG